MPYHRQKPNTPSDRDLYDVANASVLVCDGGALVPVVARSRRTVTVAHDGQRIPLKRRRLERAGVDHVDGHRFSVTNYTTDLTSGGSPNGH